MGNIFGGVSMNTFEFSYRLKDYGVKTIKPTVKMSPKIPSTVAQPVQGEPLCLSLAILIEL